MKYITKAELNNYRGNIIEYNGGFGILNEASEKEISVCLLDGRFPDYKVFEYPISVYENLAQGELQLYLNGFINIRYFVGAIKNLVDSPSIEELYSGFVFSIDSVDCRSAICTIREYEGLYGNKSYLIKDVNLTSNEVETAIRLTVVFKKYKFGLLIFNNCIFICRSIDGATEISSSRWESVSKVACRVVGKDIYISLDDLVEYESKTIRRSNITNLVGYINKFSWVEKVENIKVDSVFTKEYNEFLGETITVVRKIPVVITDEILKNNKDCKNRKDFSKETLKKICVWDNSIENGRTILEDTNDVLKLNNLDIKEVFGFIEDMKYSLICNKWYRSGNVYYRYIRNFDGQYLLFLANNIVTTLSGKSLYQELCRYKYKVLDDGTKVSRGSNPIVLGRFRTKKKYESLIEYYKISSSLSEIRSCSKYNKEFLYTELGNNILQVLDGMETLEILFEDKDKEVTLRISKGRKQRFWFSEEGYTIEDVRRLLSKVLSKDKNILDIVNSKFVIYRLLSNDSIKLDEKNIIDTCKNFNDCKKICSKRSGNRFLIVEFSEESIKSQWELRSIGKDNAIIRKIA